jgi:magnesium-transporting ATPase (P-type)
MSHSVQCIEMVLHSIPTAAIVINDLVIAKEGNTINADGEIVHSNDSQ